LYPVIVNSFFLGPSGASDFAAFVSFFVAGSLFS